MASENSAPVKENGLSTKELALYIGVPVATVCIAGGLYYYYTKKDRSKQSIDPEVKNDLLSNVKSDITEDIAQPTAKEPERTPLELAQNAKSKGNKYFKAGRFEQAIECYTTAINNCPTTNLQEISTFYQNRAAAHEQLKNWENVVSDSTKAIELNNKYTKALSRRARAYEMLDEKRNCLEDVTAVCLLEGFQNQQCMILADRILKSFGKELAEKYFKTRPHTLPSPVFVKSYLDSFNEDIFSVTKDEASETYNEITDGMQNKQYEHLIDLCTKEINDSGKNMNLSYLLRGTLYTLMCDIDNAMKDFELILKLENNENTKKLKVDALIKRGSLNMQLAKDKECYEDFSEAIKIDSENPNIYHHRGQLYFLTERLQEGRSDFEKAIKLDPNFVAPRLQLGYCLCKIAMQTMQPSMIQEANKILQDACDKFPKYAETWSLYGQLLQDQQRFDEASEMLEKAISIAPDNPTTYVYKALLVLQWKQDVDKANTLIRKAIDIDDKCDFAYETLATLEVQKCNNEEAVRLFTKAIDLVRTEAEMANTFSLLEAAKAQSKIIKEYGITLPKVPGMM